MQYKVLNFFQKICIFLPYLYNKNSGTVPERPPLREKLRSLPIRCCVLPACFVLQIQWRNSNSSVTLCRSATVCSAMHKACCFAPTRPRRWRTTCWSGCGRGGGMWPDWHGFPGRPCSLRGAYRQIYIMNWQSYIFFCEGDCDEKDEKE